MVRKSHSAAFTLIELIFAIVIISIVFLSLPSLSSTNTDAIKTSLNQEALFAASAELSKVLTFRWDQNSKIADPITNALSEHEFIVDTQNSSDLNRSGSTAFRVGHIDNGTDKHRQFHTTVTSVNGATNNSDILSKAVTNRELFTTAASGSTTKGYKQHYRIDVNVAYCSDTITSAGYQFQKPASSPPAVSNMKVIETVIDLENVDNTWDNGIIVLRSYAANIGEVELNKW